MVVEGLTRIRPCFYALIHKIPQKTLMSDNYVCSFRVFIQSGSM